MKKLIAGIALAGALVLGVPQAAVASPLSYTQRHCGLMAQSFLDERYSASIRQIRLLAQPPAILSVRRDAQAVLGADSQREFNREFVGLTHSCLAVFPSA